jgi:MoaA/NifB/PqqE/SkfB family radical SAM enzyme
VSRAQQYKDINAGKTYSLAQISGSNCGSHFLSSLAKTPISNCMNDFYCAAPWRGLHINPRGDVKTCCAGDPNMLGNLNTQSIEQILNSSTLKEVRSSIARGQPHSYCSNCVKAERYGADSERAWHNNNNPNFDYTSAGDQYHYPVIVDVRWNTTCNLSCNYCGSACSSQWAAIEGIKFKSGTRPYYDSVCDFLQNHHDKIKEVALVGGEPLLLPENNRLLDVIPKDVIITLITNMSVDLESNKIFKKLQSRNKVGWSMSFDNIGAQFEYVRYGGDWELLKHNLAMVKDLMKTSGHWGGIHAVYNVYNATRITELRQFAQENEITVLWQNLFQPTYLDPLLHGQQFAELAANEIEKFYATGMAIKSEKIFFDQALQGYRQVVDNRGDITEKFKQHINAIETQYHKSKQGEFAKLWPEIHKLL